MNTHKCLDREPRASFAAFTQTARNHLAHHSRIGNTRFEQSRDSVRFLLRHGDAEITVMLESSVPPADLGKVTIFATQIAKYQQQARF